MHARVTLSIDGNRTLGWLTDEHAIASGGIVLILDDNPDRRFLPDDLPPDHLVMVHGHRDDVEEILLAASEAGFTVTWPADEVGPEPFPHQAAHPAVAVARALPRTPAFNEEEERLLCHRARADDVDARKRFLPSVPAWVIRRPSFYVARKIRTGDFVGAPFLIACRAWQEEADGVEWLHSGPEGWL